MSWSTLLAALGAALLALAYGLVAGHRKLFPLGLLLRAKRHWLRATPVAVAPAGGFIIDLVDNAAVLTRRDTLAAYIWGASGIPLARLPDDTGQPATPAEQRLAGDLADAQCWTVRMAHGIDSRVLVLMPRGPRRGTVVIYQQGHEGDVAHGRTVLRRLLQAGYPVAALAMPLLGQNSRPVVQLRRHGPVQLLDHDHFRLLDHEFGGNSIRYFLEPVTATLNQFGRQGERRFAMLGWSGGGWTTTLCAALDSRIQTSFSVAGSLPFSLRRSGELADYENHLPSLYDIANYPELHVLAAHGTGRCAWQVLNEFDTVAWSGRRGALYEPAVRDCLARLGGGGAFTVFIDDSWVGHGISRVAMDRVLALLAAAETGSAA
jgi:dienelactone hydrolase